MKRIFLYLVYILYYPIYNLLIIKGVMKLNQNMGIGKRLLLTINILVLEVIQFFLYSFSRLSNETWAGLVRILLVISFILLFVLYLYSFKKNVFHLVFLYETIVFVVTILMFGYPFIYGVVILSPFLIYYAVYFLSHIKNIVNSLKK